MAVLPVLTLIAVGLILFFRSQKDSPLTENGLVRFEKNGSSVEVSRNGLVEFNSGKTALFRNVSDSQLTDLIKYLKENGKKKTYGDDLSGYYLVYVNEDGGIIELYLPGDDGVIGGIYDEFEEGGGNGSGGGEGGGEDDGDDDGDAFQFPTPTSTPAPTPTPLGGSNGGDDSNGDSGIPDDCPLWLLSYCVYPPSPRPTVTPTSTPFSTPPADVETDCSYWEYFIHNQAVVSNTHCPIEE